MFGAPPLVSENSNIELEFNDSSYVVDLLVARSAGTPVPARHTPSGTPVLLHGNTHGQRLQSSNPMELRESMRRREKEEQDQLQEVHVQQDDSMSSKDPPLKNVLIEPESRKSKPCSCC